MRYFSDFQEPHPLSTETLLIHFDINDNLNLNSNISRLLLIVKDMINHCRNFDIKI